MTSCSERQERNNNGNFNKTLNENRFVEAVGDMKLTKKFNGF